MNRYASLVAENVKSLGVSLSVCSTPGQAVDPRLNDSDLYELGLGIHGEPGAKSGKMKAVGVGKPASALIHELVDTLLKNGTLISNTELHASKVSENMLHKCKYKRVKLLSQNISQQN